MAQKSSFPSHNRCMEARLRTNTHTKKTVWNGQARVTSRTLPRIRNHFFYVLDKESNEIGGKFLRAVCDRCFAIDPNKFVPRAKSWLEFSVVKIGAIRGSAPPLKHVCSNFRSVETLAPLVVSRLAVVSYHDGRSDLRNAFSAASHRSCDSKCERCSASIRRESSDRARSY